MSEESESLSLLHSAKREKIEHNKDSVFTLAFNLNVISRGWHQGKVAMRGKENSKRLGESGQSLGSSGCIGSIACEGMARRAEIPDKREYSSDLRRHSDQYKQDLFC
jgi:hypothetical protein